MADQDGNKDQTQDQPSEQEQDSSAGIKAEDLPLPEASFMTFIAGMGAQALVHLGVVPDPASGKTQVQIKAAKYTIDMLAVIEQKTAGNLTDDEKRHLDGLLYELRVRYVNVAGGA